MRSRHHQLKLVANGEVVARFAVALAEGYTGRMAAKPQFSLRWIFAATAAIAVMLGEAVAFPESVAEIVGLIVMSLLFPAFAAGIVDARGFSQAFCIGALVRWLHAIWMLFEGITNVHIFDGGRIDYCVYWSMIFAGGLVAVVVRWLAMSTASTQPPRSGDGI